MSDTNMTTEHTNEPTHHGPGYKMLTAIWGVLMVLTVITILAAEVDFGFLNVVIALSIATVKATLVVLFFMHLKYENWLFKGLVLLTFAVLAIFIGFTFFDTAFR